MRGKSLAQTPDRLAQFIATVREQSQSMSVRTTPKLMRCAAILINCTKKWRDLEWKNDRKWALDLFLLRRFRWAGNADKLWLFESCAKELIRFRSSPISNGQNHGIYPTNVGETLIYPQGRKS